MIHQRLAGNRKSRSGNTLIEFSLLGIPIVFITMTIVSVSIAMWQFHCLAYASEASAAYASVHGATCAQNGNSCSITIGNMATYFASQAIALPQSQVTVKFKDGSGTTTCNPSEQLHVEFDTISVGFVQQRRHGRDRDRHLYVKEPHWNVVAVDFCAQLYCWRNIPTKNSVLITVPSGPAAEGLGARKQPFQPSSAQ